MRRLEHPRRWRAFFSLALLLWLALLGTGAGASIPAPQEAGPVAVAAWAPASMPMAMDGAPCVQCYVAPAPATQGFGAERHEPEESVWRVHAPPVPDTRYFDTGGRQAGLPVRILYCRWLD